MIDSHILRGGVGLCGSNLLDKKILQFLKNSLGSRACEVKKTKKQHGFQSTTPEERRNISKGWRDWKLEDPVGWRDWKLEDPELLRVSEEEFADLLFKKERSLLRARGRERSADRWTAPSWNPERSLVPVEETTYSRGEFEANPNIVVVDPRIVAFLLANPDRLFSLSPRQFEELVAELMEKLGYRVQLGPAGRDGGVDVFAERQSDLGEELVLVQCKQFREDRKVGEPVIKQLHADVFDRNATRGLVATTSHFSSCALDYIQRNRYRLSGADRDQLFAWMARLRSA